jgi:hypothetical protein
MATFFQVHVPNSIWSPSASKDGPSVGIRLGQHGYAIDGSIIVGPLMASEKEIDATIDTLVKQLESLRREAKQALRGTS